METGKELTGTDEKPYQHAHDIHLSVHFLATDKVAISELDLVMTALDDIIAEMRRLEGGTIQGTDPGCSHPPLQGKKPCL